MKNYSYYSDDDWKRFVAFRTHWDEARSLSAFPSDAHNGSVQRLVHDVLAPRDIVGWNVGDHYDVMASPLGTVLICEPYVTEDRPSRKTTLKALRGLAAERPGTFVAVGFAHEGQYAARTHLLARGAYNTVTVAWLLGTELLDGQYAQKFVDRIVRWTPKDKRLSTDLPAADADSHSGYADLSGTDWVRAA